MAMQMTEDQFQTLLDQLRVTAPAQAPVAKRSITSCPIRYNGARDDDRVNEFITAATIYKTTEQISDVSALEGLPLLLTDTAHTWWEGVKTGVTTWSNAMARLREAFAPARPAYKIYAEIFKDRQSPNTPTDLFITKKRSLVAQLPAPGLTESVQLDMIYGLLRVDLRERLDKTEITTFDDLLKKTRRIEDDLSERKLELTADQMPKRSRCEFCRNFGHVTAECQKQKIQGKPRPSDAKQPNQTDGTTENSNTGIRCYGCQRPGVIRRNCPTCQASVTNPIGFCSFNFLVPPQPKGRPAVTIDVLGLWGTAFLDTGSRISIASPSLCDHLKSKGVVFQRTPMTVVLADGNPHLESVWTTVTTVCLKNKKFSTRFVSLPDAPLSRTLLGIDFIENAGMVLDFASRQWHYKDQADSTFHFTDKDGTGSQTPSREEVAGALDAVGCPPLLSPMATEDMDRMHPPILPPRGCWAVYQAPGGLEYMYNDAEKEWNSHPLSILNNEESRPLFPTSPVPIDIASINILHTDASQYALGAALLQGEGDDGRPIEYPRSVTDLRQSQLSDTEVTKILNHLTSGTQEETRGWISRGLVTNTGVLYRYNPDSDSDEPQLVVPQQERINVLETHHDEPSTVHNSIQGKYHTSALMPFQGEGAKLPTPVAPIRKRGRHRQTKPHDH